MIQKYINVLGEAVDMIGGPQIRKYRNDRGQYLQRRNLGGFGFDLTCVGCHRGDYRAKRVRQIPIHDFYIKAGTVDLKPGEIPDGYPDS